MCRINNLTPDIKGKAFDPDWFLLRQRLEAFESDLAAVTAERDEALRNQIIHDRWRSDHMGQHCGAVITKLRVECDNAVAERDKAQKYQALCRQQFEVANAAADRIDKERRAAVAARDAATTRAEAAEQMVQQQVELLAHCDTSVPHKTIIQQSAEIARLKEERDAYQMSCEEYSEILGCVGADRAAIAAKLSEAQRDTERLDWLAQQFEQDTGSWPAWTKAGWMIIQMCGEGTNKAGPCASVFKTFREALVAARQEAK